MCALFHFYTQDIMYSGLFPIEYEYYLSSLVQLGCTTSFILPSKQPPIRFICHPL